MALYTHFPIRLHGMVLNQLSTGTVLPSTQNTTRYRNAERHTRIFTAWRASNIDMNVYWKNCTSMSRQRSVIQVNQANRIILSFLYGHAIAQAFSRRFPIAVKSCGICGGQNGTGTVFFQMYSVFPANSHSTDCSTLIIIRGWYNTPVSGLSLTPPQETKTKLAV
jgi:hypothetical protein